MGNWRDRADETIWMRCQDDCSTGMTASAAAEQMKSLDQALREAGREPRFYSFGDHVTDPVALVRRFLHIRVYQIVPDRPDRMVCPRHRSKE